MVQIRSTWLLLALALVSCSEPGSSADVAGDAAPDDAGVRDASADVSPPDPESVYALAKGCFAAKSTIGSAELWLRATPDGYRFASGAEANATRFFFQPSDLGTYLLYDNGGGYLHSDNGVLDRPRKLRSDIYEVDDAFVSGAEWHIESVASAPPTFQLQHRKTGLYLGPDGLVESVGEAAWAEFVEANGCRPHPEMSLDAEGTVAKTMYDDGVLFGFVDTHAHILANFGFGGGGIQHGAPFHRLGVEVALGSCEPFHAEEGRADFLGWGQSSGAASEVDEAELINLLVTGRLRRPAHATDGWPTFSDWPSQRSATHQAEYYRWLERAWLSGLRLVVQHAVSNEVFCRLMADTEFQPVRWGCGDMENVDRQLDEVRRMERYIDAQSGGPGLGWFRVVESPEEAREVIAAGKMAVVLGIEVPNLFSCYLTPPDGAPVCDEAWVEAQLDEYYAKGVRVLFPNHKFDNAFTPGDGDRGIVELGNWMQTGHWSNFVEECPDVPNVFDKGSVQFGGFNEPRDVYLSSPPNEPVELTPEPLRDLLPYVDRVREPPIEGDHCQNGGLTELGRKLIRGMMTRGIIVEIDHLPRWSYLDAFDMLVEADYPAAGTHQNTNRGRLYEIGGVSQTKFERCADPENPGSMARPFRERRDMIRAAGGFEAEGFGFDLNGLAGVPDPRFGPDARCGAPQENPVEYPFTSYGGDVTFTRPAMGDRVVDFNTEGMIHIGLVPELIEDARRTGVTDEDLDFVFRSAEGYIQMWERAERRAAILREQ